MEELKAALGKLWLNHLPWLTPVISGLFAIVCTILGVQGSSIITTWKDSESSLWDILISYPAILVAAFLLILFALTGLKQHQQNKNNKEQIASLKACKNEIKESSHSAREKLTSAEEEINTLRSNLERALWENTSSYLRRCVRDLEFTVDDRVSIFVSCNDYFILAGRFSPHPEYGNPRRRKFNISEGCVSLAWYGNPFYSNLPDVRGNYKHYLKRANTVTKISKEVMSEIRMKSRCYYAQALHSTSTSSRVGVIVFESIQKDRYLPDTLRNLINHKENHLTELIMQSAEVSSFLLSNLQHQEDK